MDNRVRELRADLGWTQSELDERLGVSRQSINAIEAGRYDPSLPLAFRIAEVFELPIERIFRPGSADARQPGRSDPVRTHGCASARIAGCRQ